MKQILLISYLFISINQNANTAIITPPPITSPQNFCDVATVSELTATGINLQWYENASEGDPLSAETPLSSGTYYVSQTIDDEESERVAVEVTINQAPLIDELGLVYGCSFYTLPELSVGNYFGDENHSEPFFAGDVIDASQTMYIYGENECGNAQSAFYIIIESALSLPPEENAEVCNSYFLPDFSEGAYYTETGGNGATYFGGEEITMSQTLYKYVVNSCGSAETVLNITINTGPYVDFLDDVYTCESYTLPYISSGNFYTEPNTSGDLLQPGDIITSSQVIYLYAGNGCGDAQGSFYVNISDIDNTITLEENTLTANQTDAVYEWWDCNEEVFVSDESGQSFTPSIAGLYSVLITYGDCTAWSDCILSSPLAIEENQPDKISFFPNPVSSTLNIVSKHLEKIEKVIIIDVSGKIVLQQYENTNLVDVEKLGPGIYILQAFSNGNIYTHKLFKQ